MRKIRKATLQLFATIDRGAEEEGEQEGRRDTVVEMKEETGGGP